LVFPPDPGKAWAEYSATARKQRQEREQREQREIAAKKAEKK